MTYVYQCKNCAKLSLFFGVSDSRRLIWTLRLYSKFAMIHIRSGHQLVFFAVTLKVSRCADVYVKMDVKNSGYTDSNLLCLPRPLMANTNLVWETLEIENQINLKSLKYKHLTCNGPACLHALVSFITPSSHGQIIFLTCSWELSAKLLPQPGL